MKIGDKVKYKRMDGNYAYGTVFDINDARVEVKILPELSNSLFMSIPESLLEPYENVSLVETSSVKEE